MDLEQGWRWESEQKNRFLNHPRHSSHCKGFSDFLSMTCCDLISSKHCLTLQLWPWVCFSFWMYWISYMIARKPNIEIRLILTIICAKRTLYNCHINSRLASQLFHLHLNTPPVLICGIGQQTKSLLGIQINLTGQKGQFQSI